MNKIIASVVLVQLLLALAYAQDPDKWMADYCTKGITDAKAQEFDKCIQLMPDQYTVIVKKCVEAANVGLNFKSYIKIYCDKSLWKKHNECLDKESKSIKPEDLEGLKTKMAQYNECIMKTQKAN